MTSGIMFEQTFQSADFDSRNFNYRLCDIETFLQWMNEIQRKWIYLEPIFARGSLPSEASRFNRVDVEFCAVLSGQLPLYSK